jgi:hypothetical protein
LPDTQAQTQSPRAAARLRYPKCQSQTEVRYIAAARIGFQHWTLPCTRCGPIHEAQVGTDPMKSDAAGRQRGGLPAPQ